MGENLFTIKLTEKLQAFGGGAKNTVKKFNNQLKRGRVHLRRFNNEMKKFRASMVKAGKRVGVLGTIATLVAVSFGKLRASTKKIQTEFDRVKSYSERRTVVGSNSPILKAVERLGATKNKDGTYTTGRFSKSQSVDIATDILSTFGKDIPENVMKVILEGLDKHGRKFLDFGMLEKKFGTRSPTGATHSATLDTLRGEADAKDIPQRTLQFVKDWLALQNRDNPAGNRVTGENIMNAVDDSYLALSQKRLNIATNTQKKIDALLGTAKTDIMIQEKTAEVMAKIGEAMEDIRAWLFNEGGGGGNNQSGSALPGLDNFTFQLLTLWKNLRSK